MKLHQAKLDRFTTYAKFQEFISHLETIPTTVNFIVSGDANEFSYSGAIILEFEAVNAPVVYYYSDMDNVANKPIIAVGRDCEVTTKLTDWDQEQLELKRILSWGV